MPYRRTAKTAKRGGSGSPIGAPPRLSHVNATVSITPELTTPTAPTMRLYATRRPSHQPTTASGRAEPAARGAGGFLLPSGYPTAERHDHGQGRLPAHPRARGRGGRGDPALRYGRCERPTGLLRLRHRRSRAAGDVRGGLSPALARRAAVGQAARPDDARAD